MYQLQGSFVETEMKRRSGSATAAANGSSTSTNTGFNSKYYQDSKYYQEMSGGVENKAAKENQKIKDLANFDKNPAQRAMEKQETTWQTMVMSRYEPARETAMDQVIQALLPSGFGNSHKEQWAQYVVNRPVIQSSRQMTSAARR